MKNICFVNSYTFWGGGEKSYFQYAKELNKIGYKIHFLLKKGSVLGKRVEEEKWAEVNYIKTGSSCQYNPILFFKMVFFLIRNKIDVIFVNTHRDWKAVGIPAKICGIKKIIYTKGTSDSIGYSYTRKFYFDNIISDVLVKSEDSKRKLLETDSKLMKGKIVVIKNGIEMEKFKDRRERIENESIELGVTARLESVKRVGDLIETADILSRKYKLKFRLSICGDGDERAKLEKMVSEKGLNDIVSFEGFKSDIVEFLNKVDIFLFASEMEGMSNSIMEAMAMGKPVICYNISSMPELIRDGENGMLVTPFDIEEFAAKIYQLSEDREMRRKFGKAAIKIAEEEFSMKNVIRNYENLINA